MIHVMNEKDFLNSKSEMLYQFHQRIDETVYPQVHDFYELSLVTGGSMQMSVGKWNTELKTASLILLRPGDVHYRSGSNCSYINIAFPSRVVDSMFDYLGTEQGKSLILKQAAPPLIHLSNGDYLLLKARMERLKLLPVNASYEIRAELRLLMIDTITQYIVPKLQSVPDMNCPRWLSELSIMLDSPESFDLSLEQLAQKCGYSKEHLCRSCKQYFGFTPTTYINARRLNYAANLLLHSDEKVVDIAFTSGFQSLSRFYHAFKQEYGVSPLEYRKKQLPQS